MKKFVFFIAVLSLSLVGIALFANDLLQTRKYEWVVHRGGAYQSLFNTPVSQIRMYAYDAKSAAWQMIPFQIDEVSETNEPYKRETFFHEHNGVLDALDEIVFMVRDLGDRADYSQWIDNTDSQSNPRIEIQIYDPDAPEKKAYGYLFASSTFDAPVPAPYGFQVDPQNHRIETNQYRVGFDEETTLIKDIAVKAPYGSGVDIFDTQKFRFVGKLLSGLLNFRLDGATENYFLSYPAYDAYTESPVIRAIHNSRLTIIDKVLLEDISFFNDPKFYPFGGELSGGIELSENIIQEKMGTNEDVEVIINLLRQSWDFNEAATGMTFSNAVNAGIPIDGIADNVDKTVAVPVQEWSCVTGDQGTVLLYLDLKDSTWQQVELYYHDNETGGQADAVYHEADETGDSKSFGDHGVLFRNQSSDTVNLQLKFKAYFLEGNISDTERDLAIHSFQHPVRISVNSGYLSAVEEAFLKASYAFRLHPNYPNPFNGITQITFTLMASDHVTLSVFDMNGRLISTLLTGTVAAGSHRVFWQGNDASGKPVSSGIYLVRLQSSQAQQTIKMTLMQ